MDDVVFSQISDANAPNISVNEKEPLSETSSMPNAEKRLISNYEKVQYTSLTVHEKMLIQGYGRFLNMIDACHTKLTKRENKEKNNALELRNVFWDHLTNMCSQLHNLSVVDPRALRYLQLLLSALYEFSNNMKQEMATSEKIETRERKLRFSDPPSSSCGKRNVNENDTPSTGDGMLMNKELQKVVSDLAIESLSVVIKASLVKSLPDTATEQISDRQNSSKYYSDQLDFISGLLKQHKRSLVGANDANTMAFYNDLWQGIKIYLNEEKGEVLIEQGMNTDVRSANANSDIIIDEHASILGILTTMFRETMFTNRHLKDKAIQLKYIDVYLIVLESLPLETRVSFLTAELHKLYVDEVPSAVAVNAHVSRLEWIFLIIQRMVLPISGNQGLLCLRKMAEFSQDGQQCLSSMMSNLSIILFGTKFETKSQVVTGNDINSSTKLLHLLIEHVGCVLPDHILDQIFMSLHMGCKNANQILQDTSEDALLKIKLPLISKVRNAVSMIHQLIKKKPKSWKDYSFKGKNIELVLTLVKISTYNIDSLNADDFRYKLTNCWIEGLNVLHEQNSTDASNERYTLETFVHSVTQFINHRISELQTLHDQDHPENSFVNRSIDLLAQQAWEYLFNFYKQCHEGEGKETCWRLVLCDMVIPKQVSFVDKDMENEQKVKALVDRVTIESLPELTSRYSSKSEMVRSDRGIRECMNAISCRFFLKICSNVLLKEDQNDKISNLNETAVPTSIKQLSNKSTDIKQILRDSLFNNMVSNEEDCPCNKHQPNDCIETINSILIDTLSFTVLRSYNSDTYKRLSNPTDLSEMVYFVVVNGGIVTERLLNQSLQCSIQFGWEYSLGLERFLVWMRQSQTKVHYSGEYCHSKNVAEIMATDTGLLPGQNIEIATKALEQAVIQEDSTDFKIKSGVEKWTEEKIHTIMILMEFLDRDTVSSILMTEIGHILSLDPIGDESSSLVVQNPIAPINNEKYACRQQHHELKCVIGSSFFLVGACLKRLAKIEGYKPSQFKEHDGTLLQDEKIALKALLQLIWNWRQNFEEDFLFSCNLFERNPTPKANEKDTLEKHSSLDETYENIAFVIAIIEFLEQAVQHLTFTGREKDLSIQEYDDQKPILNSIIEPSHWDLILCALSAWTQSIEETHVSELYQGEKISSKLIKSEKEPVCENHSSDHRLSSLRKKLLARNFGRSVSTLTNTVSRWITTLIRHSDNEKIEKEHATEITEEWKNFFADGIYSIILNVFVTMASNFQANATSKHEKKSSEKLNVYRKTNDILISQLLIAFGSTLRTIPDEQLTESHGLPAKFNTQDVITCSPEQLALPDNIVFLLNHLCPLLFCSERSIQTTAFHLLNQTMRKIAEHETLRSTKQIETDKHLDATTDEEDADECREIPKRLAEILKKTEPVINALFEKFEFSFGEPLPTPLPIESAAYNSTLTYLLTWRLIISLVKNISGDDLRPKYSEFLRKGGHLETVMMLLFHTMIPPVEENNQKQNVFWKENSFSDCAHNATPDKFQSNKASKNTFNSISSSFVDESLKKTLSVPPLDCNSNCSSLEMQSLARNIYYGMLKYLPALVRNWWNLSDKRTANAIETFTTSQVAPTLWSEEVERISSVKTDAFDNMTIKVRSTVREVVAIYTLGDDGSEGSMELVIQLPANFPLGAVQVESGKRVGVTTSQWRTWMLQLTTFLQHQNGSIVDGLTVWKRNVDKRFQGVEECYICFYVLHGTNHQLPKLACRTCKKKFHAACLYKWFSTSNNSTCPLCRNLF